MPTNEKTSKRLAKLAAEALADPCATKREKALAGSVLTQAPDKPKRKAKAKPKAAKRAK